MPRVTSKLKSCHLLLGSFDNLEGQVWVKIEKRVRARNPISGMNILLNLAMTFAIRDK